MLRMVAVYAKTSNRGILWVTVMGVVCFPEVRGCAAGGDFVSLNTEFVGRPRPPLV